MRFRRVLSVFDANRRFAPVYDDAQTVDVEADTVLLSVGQMPDLSFLGEVTRLQVDPESCETGTPGVFAAGDVAYGARLMIDAIASGKKAARGVYRFLIGQEILQHETQPGGRFAGRQSPSERNRQPAGLTEAERRTAPGRVNAPATAAGGAR